VLLALTLETARNLALAGVVVFVALAVLTALLMRSIAQKIAFALVLGLVAVLVWSQRASLDDCADRVRASVEAGATTDTTCSFFGQDVRVAAPRSA
jgi:hypothetical protein